MSDGARANPISILLVEDDPDHRLLTERALREAGFAVRTAASGEEALRSSAGADLVLLDYRLPGMSGTEVLAELRSRGGPPVVFVTGMGSEQIAVDAMRAGALDYVVKNPGYLRALPKAVDRAWRHFDLAHRAEELERLGLLLTSVTEREAVLPQIARGLRMLLRADACAVAVAGPYGVAVEAVDGDAAVEAADIVRDVDAFLGEDRGPAGAAGHDATKRLLVPLPASDGAALGALVVITHTPRRYVAEEVRLARTFASFAGIALGNVAKLELERRLAAELQGMLDMRAKLVSSVSHELRTPLTSIVGFAETLCEKWTSIEDRSRLEYVDIIRRQGTELAALVDNLLDFSTLEAGRTRVVITPLDLRACVQATLDTLAPLMRGRPVEVAVDDVLALGDIALVRRTLTNLLSNAVKYSERGAPIAVHCRRHGERCRIEVVDRGPGLTEQEATAAFEPFWRAERDWTVRGSGIGLSLVREYARLMKGEAGVESEPGQGSTFFVVLPLADAVALSA